MAIFIYCKIIFFSLYLFLNINSSFALDWACKRSPNFVIIYQARYRCMIPHIIEQAETCLQQYQKLFHYTPKDKLTLLIRDSRDIAAASAATFPLNTIKIDIAPGNSDYEFTFHNQHFRWLVSHELAHIIINDQHDQPQTGFRKVIGKATPVSEDPMTLPFSVITNPNRYTPLWFQEGIAVFCETWLNAGGGRVLSSFDEMYFRTLVHTKKPLLVNSEIDDFQENHFLLETYSYLYGTRFISWMTLQFSPLKVIEWYNHKKLFNYKNKFKHTFGISLSEGWQRFIKSEKEHQKNNIAKIKNTDLTILEKKAKPTGWVSQAYIDRSGRNIYFASHQAHELASLKKLDIKSNSLTTISSLHTPSLVDVSSTAFDSTFGFFFYTTQNTRGFRDLWAIDIQSKKKKLIFRNTRMGDLTINPSNHNLWGIRVQNGLSSLVISPFPYRNIITVFTLPFRTYISQLAIAPTGKKMAAILRYSNGFQKLILIDLHFLLEEQKLVFEIISNQGNPEHPSWSENGDQLFWDAYTSGIANIYTRCEGDTQNHATSNVIKGLFRPCHLTRDTLFAFLFTPDGFQPVIFKAKQPLTMTTIQYLGQKVVQKHPVVKSWAIPKEKVNRDTPTLTKSKSYHWWQHMHHSMTVPFMGASLNTRVIGLSTEFRDRLYEHRIFSHIGVDKAKQPCYLFKYSYRDALKITLKNNPATFYDLINQRKTSIPGKSATFEIKKWWLYDLPTKIEQWTTFLWGRGLTDIETKNYSIDQTNLIGIKTQVSGKHLRKRIGGVQFEKGYKWNFKLLWTKSIDNSASNAYLASVDYTHLWDGWSPHHVFRTMFASGFASGDALSLGRFFFGGFGNRLFENISTHRYRDVSSLPGLGYKELISNRFAKIHLETTLPPLSTPFRIWKTRCRKSIGNLFVMGLLTRNLTSWQPFLSCGFQCDILFRHLFTVDSALSFGLGRAWSFEQSYNHLYFSFKLFRDSE